VPPITFEVSVGGVTTRPPWLIASVVSSSASQGSQGSYKKRLKRNLFASFFNFKSDSRCGLVKMFKSVNAIFQFLS
jgi:hypothetical protein